MRVTTSLQVRTMTASFETCPKVLPRAALYKDNVPQIFRFISSWVTIRDWPWALMIFPQSRRLSTWTWQLSWLREHLYVCSCIFVSLVMRGTVQQWYVPAKTGADQGISQGRGSRGSSPSDFTKLESQNPVSEPQWLNPPLQKSFRVKR